MRKTNYKEFILSRIKEAGKIAKNNFRVAQKHSRKPDKSILTATDIKIDKYLIKEIKKNFPEHNIISEEHPATQNNSEYTWFIDPIDGTINFAQGIPFFCVVVGLAKGKEMIYGAVYDPMQDELFFAEKGKGAFLNGKKFKSTAREELTYDAMVSVEIWRRARYNLMDFRHDLFDIIDVLTKRQSTAMCGSYSAVGRMDGAVYAHNNVWDVAAISLIGEEAGLKVTELDGKKFVPRPEMKGIVMAKPKVHEALMKIIKKYIK